MDRQGGSFPSFLRKLENEPSQLLSGFGKFCSAPFPASHFLLTAKPGLEIPIFFFFFPGNSFSQNIFSLARGAEEMPRVLLSRVISRAPGCRSRAEQPPSSPIPESSRCQARVPCPSSTLGCGKGAQPAGMGTMELELCKTQHIKHQSFLSAFQILLGTIVRRWRFVEPPQSHLDAVYGLVFAVITGSARATGWWHLPVLW